MFARPVQRHNRPVPDSASDSGGVRGYGEPEPPPPAAGPRPSPPDPGAVGHLTGRQDRRVPRIVYRARLPGITSPGPMRGRSTAGLGIDTRPVSSLQSLGNSDLLRILSFPSHGPTHLPRTSGKPSVASSSSSASADKDGGGPAPPLGQADAGVAEGRHEVAALIALDRAALGVEGPGGVDRQLQRLVRDRPPGRERHGVQRRVVDRRRQRPPACSAGRRTSWPCRVPPGDSRPGSPPEPVRERR